MAEMARLTHMIRPLTRPLTRPLAAALLIAVAGCAASGSAMNELPIDSNQQARRSPAQERVISGVADIALSDRAWDSFAHAQENPVTTLRDGGQLYAHIRSTRPLGDIAHPGDPDSAVEFSRYPHLFLQVGDNESMRILSTCYVTLGPEEAQRTELVVPLAPLTYRPGDIPADCWLQAVTNRRPGNNAFEVRLAGFAGKFERWLPVPDLLAVGSVRLDNEAGASQYATMLKAPPMRYPTTVATASALPGAVTTPIRGSSLVTMNAALPGTPKNLGNDRMDSQLQTLATALLGRRPTSTWFTDGNWTSNLDARGQIVSQHAFAAAVFKGERCSWTRLKVFRRPDASSIGDVEQAGEPIEVGCDDLR